MDFSLLQKYWYVALGGLILLFFLRNRSQSQGGGVVQIGGDIARDQLAVQTALAEDSMRFDTVGQLLNYSLTGQSQSISRELALRQQDIERELGVRSQDLQQLAIENGYQLSQSQLQNAMQQFSQNYQLQLAALKKSKSKNVAGILSSIFNGTNQLLPILFGQNGIFHSGGSGGGSVGFPDITLSDSSIFGGTPPIFGSDIGGGNNAFTSLFNGGWVM